MTTNMRNQCLTCESYGQCTICLHKATHPFRSRPSLDTPDGWDSKRLIGDVNMRFGQLRVNPNYHWHDDWRAFYHGWNEGRIAMLAELRQQQVNK